MTLARLSAFTLLSSLLLLSAIGCGEKGPQKYAVSGVVNYGDGTLPKGYIVFTPVDGATAPESAVIDNGRYAVAMLPGKKKVEITAEREAPGGVDAVMGAPRKEQYIAEKYNIETTLEANVTPEGPNVFDYDVSD